MNKLFTITATLALLATSVFSNQDKELVASERVSFTAPWHRHKILYGESIGGWPSFTTWSIKIPAPKHGTPTSVIIEFSHEYQYKYIAWNISNKQGTGEGFYNIHWKTNGNLQGVSLEELEYQPNDLWWIFEPWGVFWGTDRPKIEVQFDEHQIISGPFEINQKKYWKLNLDSISYYTIKTSVPMIFGSTIKERLVGTVTYRY